VQKWAQSKTTNREGWLQASRLRQTRYRLSERTIRGQGNGSIVFYAFPQEVQIVAGTGLMRHPG
jgi:DNA-binding transcriptional regulator PaaX